jgi:hypothetical protein
LLKLGLGWLWARLMAASWPSGRLRAGLWLKAGSTEPAACSIWPASTSAEAWPLLSRDWNFMSRVLELLPAQAGSCTWAVQSLPPREFSCVRRICTPDCITTTQTRMTWLGSGLEGAGARGSPEPTRAVKVLPEAATWPVRLGMSKRLGSVSSPSSLATFRRPQPVSGLLPGAMSIGSAVEVRAAKASAAPAEGYLAK